MVLFIGIDPGAGGGIAAVTETGRHFASAKTPDTRRGVIAFVEQLATMGETHVLIEQVHSSPQMGVVSAFSFGQSFERVLMACEAARLTYELITPRKWQSIMRCQTGGNKRISKQIAEKRFPTVKVTHAVADALLLAECCRRLNYVTLPREAHNSHAAGGHNGEEGKGRKAG